MTPSGQGDPAIQMTDLCTAFGSQKVLDGVTLTVAHGETLVVLGRSGTGKSVLLRHGRVASGARAGRPDRHFRLSEPPVTRPIPGALSRMLEA